jgi:hypothetical protein
MGFFAWVHLAIAIGIVWVLIRAIPRFAPLWRDRPFGAPGPRFFDRSARPRNAETSRAELIPDSPVGFGYKTAWLAVRTVDTARLAESLPLEMIRPCNWREGIHEARGRVFIAPPIDGWTLAVGGPLALEKDQLRVLLNRLSAAFGEAQSFSTHRGSDSHAWARSVNGAILRAFECGDGEILWNEGEPTPEERELGFVVTEPFDPPNDDADHGDPEGEPPARWPSEEWVPILAGHWSINPLELDSRTEVTGLGLRGRWLKNRLAAGLQR